MHGLSETHIIGYTYIIQIYNRQLKGHTEKAGREGHNNNGRGNADPKIFK